MDEGRYCVWREKECHIINTLAGEQKYVLMEMKDKRNRGIIVGNYYRPSGSDKRQLRKSVQMKMPKRSPACTGIAVLALCSSRLMLLSCSYTVDSTREVWASLLEPEIQKIAEKDPGWFWKGCGRPSFPVFSSEAVLALPSGHTTTLVTC